MSVLNWCFIALVILSAGWGLWRWKVQSRARARGEAVSAGAHMMNFIAWMGVAMGVVGLLALSAPTFYQWMGGDGFLGRQLGDDALMAFIAIVISAPIALAGSAYAVLLAYKSIELSEKQVELDKNSLQRQQREVTGSELALVAANFKRLSDSLQRLNAAATVCTEMGLELAGEVAEGCNPGRKKALYQGLESNALIPFRQAINELSAVLATLGQHGPSFAMLSHRLKQLSMSDANAGGLLTALLLREYFDPEVGVREFEDDTVRDIYFGYAQNREKFAEAQGLLDAVEILRLQAARLHVRDIVLQTVLNSVHEAIADLWEGSSFDPSGPEFSQRFYRTWRQSPTRNRQPDYLGGHAMRMLCDIPVIKKSISHRFKQVLSFGLLVMHDLHAVIPEKKDFEDFYKDGYVKDFDHGQAGIMALQSLQYPDKAPVTRLARSWMDSMAKEARDPNSRYMFKDWVDQDALAGACGALTSDADHDIFKAAWIRLVRAQYGLALLGPEMLGAFHEKAAPELFKLCFAGRHLALDTDDRLALEWRLMCTRLAVRAQSEEVEFEPIGPLRSALEGARRLRINSSGVEGAVRPANQPLTAERVAAIEFELFAEVIRANLDNPTGICADKWCVDDPLNWTQVIEEWVIGQMWRLAPVGIKEGDDYPLFYPEEVGAKDGLLTIVVANFAPKLAHALDTCPSGSSLAQLEFLPHLALQAPFDPAQLVHDFDTWAQSLREAQLVNQGIETLNFSGMWAYWHSELKSRYDGRKE